MDSVATNQNKVDGDVKLELDCEVVEDVEAELEDFVHLNHTSQFEAAHELFDDCLSKHDSWYPVAAEYADCLLREGKFHCLHAFCDKSIPVFSDVNEKTVLRLMNLIGSCALMEIEEPGSGFKDSWQDVVAICSSLSLSPPFTSLKDTDVSRDNEN